MTTRRALGSPAVQRSLTSIVAAILILAFPELVTKSLFILVSIGALVFGAIELVDWWRGGKKGHLLLVKALLLVAGGVSIIVFRERAVRVTELVLAGIPVLRGISNLYAARRRWKAEGKDPFRDVIKAVVALFLAATLVLIPETLLSLVVILLGLGWVLPGLVVLVNALGDEEESKAAPSDLVGVLREKTMPGDLRRQITETIFDGTDSQSGTVRFVALMSFATAIAAFGVEADSMAVVIGAMLIAPLMNPIMALSTALLMGWPRRARLSGQGVVLGMAIGIGGSFLIALISPSIVEITQNSQVLSRTSPTLLDLMIALAAGGAGAYAMTHPKVSNSLPGVTIAVALVPPLAEVGVSLEAGEFAFAGGAFLLFLTNLVGIIVAAGVVYVLSGYSAWFWVEKTSDQTRKSFGLVGLSLLLIALPLAVIGDDIIHEVTANTDAEATVETWLGADTAFDVAVVQARSGTVDVVIVGSGDLPDPAELASDLATTLDQPVQLSLRVVPETTHVVTADQSGQIISQDAL